MAKLARIGIIAAMLAGSVFMIASPAAAQASGSGTDTDTLDADEIKEKFDSFITTEFGELLQNVAWIVGVAVILLVIAKQLMTVVKSGAGIMTAVPAILVAIVAGSVLINFDVAVAFISWVISAVQTAMDSVTELLPDD